MGLLDSLIGGGEQRQDYDDFVNRYDQGHPAEGYSDEEALRRHGEVAQDVSPDDYEASAREAFDRMSPDERRELGRSLQRGSQKHGIDLPGLSGADDDRLADSGVLAGMTSQVQRQQPGMLGQLLGGGGGGGAGGMLGNPVARAALGGIAAMAVKRMLKR